MRHHGKDRNALQPTQNHGITTVTADETHCCTPTTSPCRIETHRCTPTTSPCRIETHRCTPTTSPCRIAAHRCTPTTSPCRIATYRCTPTTTLCRIATHRCTPTTICCINRRGRKSASKVPAVGAAGLCTCPGGYRGSRDSGNSIKTETIEKTRGSRFPGASVENAFCRNGTASAAALCRLRTSMRGPTAKRCSVRWRYGWQGLSCRTPRRSFRTPRCSWRSPADA